MTNVEAPTGSIPPGEVAGDLLIDGNLEIIDDLLVDGDTIETETTITDRIEVEDNNQVAQLILDGDSSPAFLSMEGNPIQNVSVIRSAKNASSNKLSVSNDVQVLNSNLEISSDLSTTGGTVIYNAGQDQIPQNRLENDSVTVAGNTVALGSSTIVDYVDLNDTGANFPIPNADIANSSVDVAGNSVSLGGSTTVDYVDLNDTGTSFPIPNADLQNTTISIDTVGNLSVSGSATLGSTVTLDASKDTATVTSNVLTNGQRTIFADVSGGALTVTLSNADTIEGKEITVVDNTGNASTNNITVDTEGSQTINGDTDAVINDDFEALTFQSDGTNFFITSRMPGGGSV